MDTALKQPVIGTVDQLNLDLLRKVLGDESITGLTPTRVGTGQIGEVYRLALTRSAPASSGQTNGSNGTPSKTGPSTVILKIASPNPRSRASAASLGIYEREVRFYAELASLLASASVPKCHHAAYDRDSGAFSLLLQDAGPDAEAGNDLVGATREQAVLAMRTLGRLHGAMLGNAAQADWLVRESPVNQALLGQLFRGFKARYGDRVQKSHWDLCERLVAVFDAYQEKLTDPGVVFMGPIHGDYRLDNMLFMPGKKVEGGEMEMMVVDWQLVTAGPLMADIAYFMGSSLRTEDRRAWQTELLGVYCKALEDLVGEPVLSVSECEANLRLMGFFGVVMCIVSSIMAGQTDRGDEMFMTLLSRNCELALDLGALDVLPQPLAVAVTTPLIPKKEDEARHEVGQDRYFNESWYFDFVDEAQGVAGWFRLGLTPHLPGRGNMYTATVTRRGMPLVLLEDYAAPAPQMSGDGGGGMTITAASYTAKLEPVRGALLQRYRMSLSGTAKTFDDPEEILAGTKPGDGGGGGNQQQVVRLQLDLEFETDGVPYMYRLATRYEVPCAVSGTLSMSNEDGSERDEIQLRGVPGQRDHSWGARDWWAMDWVWTAFHFPADGTHIHATELRIPGQPEMGMGYVQQRKQQVEGGQQTGRREGEEEEEGASVEIDELSCHEVFDEGRQAVLSMTMKIREAGRQKEEDEMVASVNVVDRAPLRLVNNDGRVALLDRAWGTVRLADGRRGVGWFEWNRNV